MGAKQSSPTANPAANGRTRAYSGSDLPSSTSGTSSSSTAGRNPAVGVRYHAPRASGAGSSTSQPQSSINIPNSGGAPSSPESGGSSPEEAAGGERSDGAGPPLLIGSLPAHLSPRLFGGKRSPVCSHEVIFTIITFRMCSESWIKTLKKRFVRFEHESPQGNQSLCGVCADAAVLLSCSCIDEWFEVNRSCPEHPSD
uniref:RING-type E3 ubiquitin transferase n=1 Tax=Oryzias sinensis TaxID=183150 RepID=A0A8C7X5E7_9TELE